MAGSAVRAGGLNRLVTIVYPVETTDSEGNTTVAFTPLRTAWAHIEPLSGTELLFAGQIEASRMIKVTIRYETDTLPFTGSRIWGTFVWGLDPWGLPKGRWPARRILYGTRTFEVHSAVDTEEAHRELELLCQELDI